jgi:beta-glucanase (GH16 family)
MHAHFAFLRRHRRPIAIIVPLVLVALIALIVFTGPPNYTFNPDFSGPAGSAPSSSQWAYDTGYGRWGNNELETYTSSRTNSFLDGQGDLILRATKSTAPDGQVTYDSARLVTKGKFSQAQGHWEARIKVTPQAGVWPAWWALGTSKQWPAGGEIDFFEDFGATGWHAAAHSAAASINSALSPMDGQFHVYRADWTVSSITFSFDGTPFMTIKPSQVPDWPFGPGKRFYMILNVAVSGIPAVGSPAGSQFPAEMVVNYVHVWR